MSQKTSKRSRRHTEDEIITEFKTPTNSSKSKEETSKVANDEEKPFKGFSVEEISPINNGDHFTATTENGNSKDSPKRVIQTRSRSNTPQNKPTDVSNGVKNSLQEEPDQKPTENGTTGHQDSPSSSLHNESVELEFGLEKEEDDIIIPELQFDENDTEIESEGSPDRCKTRRSQTRNAPTPKTPKIVEEIIPEETELAKEDILSNSTPKKPEEDSINLDLDTSDTFSTGSNDNWSTKAVAGGGDTIQSADLTTTGLYEDNSQCSSPVNNISFGDTVRGLSSRRTIRPISSDYRRIALKNNQEFRRNIGERESMERISTAGIKRKNRSETPDNIKRPKTENILSRSASSTLFSYISSPFSNIKNPFQRPSNVTPKLIAYEAKEEDFGGDDMGKNKLEIGNGKDDEKKRCIIM